MDRRALLIGCPVGGLRGVENDVEAMGQTLARHGFALDVCLGVVATRQSIIERMQRLIDASQPDDAVVIYYSGHGGRIPNLPARPGDSHPSGWPTHLQPQHYQYLIPVDIEESRPGDFRGLLAIELARVLARLTERTENVSVIVDCCFAEGVMRPLVPEGVRVREKRFTPEVTRRYQQICAHLSEMLSVKNGRDGPLLDPSSNPHAIKVWAATAEQTALERGVRQAPVRSVLTEALCGALDAWHGQSVSWYAVHEEVAARVCAITRGSQTPQLDGPGDRLLFTLERTRAGRGVSLPELPWERHARGADIARDATSGTGDNALLARFAVTWGRVRVHDPEPAATFTSAEIPPSPLATLHPGESVYFELHNRDPHTTIYWSVFDIPPDGRVIPCTSNARSGLGIQPRKPPYVLGARPNDRLYGWRMDAPAGASGGDIRVFLFVMTDRPCDLRALADSARADAGRDLGPDLRAYMEVGATMSATRSLRGAGVSDAPLRYAVMRLEFRIAPA